MKSATSAVATITALLAIGLACAHDSDMRDEWRGWKSEGFPAGWRIDANILSKEGEVEDLISKDTYGDFEAEFDWKVTNGGNAGFFYRGTREYDHIYWSAPEYQILDDAHHPDGRNRLSSAAAAYALYAAPEGIVKPADEWNAARIVANYMEIGRASCRERV